MNWKDALTDAESVSLEEMLEARERRAQIRRDFFNDTAGSDSPPLGADTLTPRRKGKSKICLLQRRCPSDTPEFAPGSVIRHRKTLISFTLNIPGEYKAFPLAEKAFHDGVSLVLALACGQGIDIDFVHGNKFKTGYEAFLSTDADAVNIKKLLLKIEDKHPLGRLFDFDVFDSNGAPMRGINLGRAERRCFICGDPVWQCARSRAHTAEELTSHVVELLSRYFNGLYADETAAKAVRALLVEVCAAPKPGLVDRADSGSHKDMDLFTFIDSGCALFPYFRDITLLGINFTDKPEQLLEAARFRGVMAESEMFAATGGVNTHKGAVFTIGILCLAAGFLAGKGRTVTEDALFDLSSKIAGEAVDELVPDSAAEQTHGRKVFQKHGLTGIRGEAAAGFPHVRGCALPVMRKYLADGNSLEEASIAALLHLIAIVEDTNIISRGNLETLHAIQKNASDTLASIGDIRGLVQYAAELNRRFIALNISPGGCADLLAAAIFVHSLTG